MSAWWAPYRPEDHGQGAPGLEIRAARIGDCPEIAAIERDGGGADEPASRARCESQCDDPRVILAVAVADSQVVGFGRAVSWERPPDPPSNAAPTGWYLLGLIVQADWRRRGVGLALTGFRLDGIAGRASEAFYFANLRNRASLDLHERLGFTELTTDFWFPGASFEGGLGVLGRIDLSARSPRASVG